MAGERTHRPQSAVDDGGVVGEVQVIVGVAADAVGAIAVNKVLR